jgi:hypothetical protein
VVLRLNLSKFDDMCGATCQFMRFARLELDSALFTPAHPPMSGASLPATEARKRRAAGSRCWLGLAVGASAIEWRPTGHLILNGLPPPHTGVHIAVFRCEAPTRRGAFADARRVVVATKVDACGCEARI